jgi:drug/metabolite transporter (DMT)-like permease
MKNIPSSQLRAYLALSLGIISLGFAGILVRWANAPGAVTGFYRMSIAVILMAPLFFNQRRKNVKISVRETAVALMAGLFFAGGLFFWNSGIIISGATNPTLMANTSPMWVGLGAMIFFREKLNRSFWLGVLLAISGAAIVLGLDALGDVGLGTFYGLLAGFIYTGYYLFTQRSRQKLDALSTFWLSSLSSTFFLFLATRLLDQPLTGYPTTSYWNFLALAVLVQAGGQLAIQFALGYLPASTVSPTVLAQPVLTAIFAIPLLDEILSFWQIVGGLIVIAGIFIVHRSRRTQPRKTVVNFPK